jgi:hypothetical protein
VRRRASLRDHGLELVARANRWLIAGAVAVTGGVALLADHAFHARAATRTSASAHQAAAGSTGTATTGTTGTGTTGTATTGTSTAVAPAPASPSPGAVVSGGS